MAKQTVGSANENEESKELLKHSDAASKKLTTNQKILIGGFAGIVVTVAVAAVIIVSILNKPAPMKQTGNLVINEENVEQITNDLQAEVEDGMFMTDMTIDWSFPDGATPSTDAYVGNSASNHRPFNFDVVLSATGETIYTSDIIPLGYSIKSIKLDKDLDAGLYDAVCTYHLLDEDTGEEDSSLSVSVTLSVLN